MNSCIARRKTPFPKKLMSRQSTALGSIVIQDLDDVKKIDPTGMQVRQSDTRSEATSECSERT